MTIHDMLSSAATDIRAMEIKIESLEIQVEDTERENVRLRKINAEEITRRLHAEADLTHYKNVFEASLCVEAMSMCKEFFNITHENMKERAEAAIQRMVEEKVEKDREASVTQSRNMEEDA